jgi:hypothetical protein
MNYFVSFAILWIVTTSTAHAQQACLSLADNDERLACYDKENHFVMPGPSVTPAPLPTIRFQVRNDGRFDNWASADIGSDPAELVVEHRNGESFVQANIALLAAFPDIGDSGWQPFASFTWQRAADADERKDQRDSSLGIVGTLGNPFDGGWGVLLTPRYIHRKDLFGETNADLATVHATFVRQKWASPQAGNNEVNQFTFFPFLGLIYEDRSVDDGHWASAYGGFEFNGQWNRLTPRLQTTLAYQYFTDSAAPHGSDKRHEDYVLASISYEFTDPDDDTAKVRPSVFLTREVGLNPLRGEDRYNETRFGLGLSVDY